MNQNDFLTLSSSMQASDLTWDALDVPLFYDGKLVAIKLSQKCIHIMIGN